MRIWLAVAVLVLASLPAHAQRKYAIMSLAGDALLIVQREMSTGSRIDRNTREFIPVSNAALDNAVVLAVDNAMHARDPAIATLMMGGRDPALLALQARALEEGRLDALIAAVKAAAQKAGATHLVLVTKDRDEARLQVTDGSVGAGRIEGFGFYIDYQTNLRDTETGERGVGFIAPFVYLALTLVDLSSGRVLAQEPVRGARASGNKKAAAPWESLTPEQKIGMLRYLLNEQVRDAVPRLIAQ